MGDIMNDPTYQFFTDEDFKKILTTQGDIQKDVAVANTNLEWIVKNYQNQCKELETLKATCETLKTELGNLKNEVWKYIGIGIGAMAVVSILISLLPTIRIWFFG
jgi:hypothetical protein